jgi:hypothetical protein
MEKTISQTQRVRLFLLAVAATAVVGVSSVLSTIPVQPVNAQTLSEYALIISTLCEGEPEIKDDKIECRTLEGGTLEVKFDNDGEVEKIELPGCEIKVDKNECPEVE